MLKEVINKTLKQVQNSSSNIIDIMPGIGMRFFQIHDALAYFQLYNHPLVKKYIPHDMIPKDIRQSSAQIHNLFLNGRNIPYWAIVLKESNQLIGSCGFVSSDFHNKRLELAYDLHPNHWHKGIVHHCLIHCIKHAFEIMHIKRLEAITLQTNVESIKVLEKLSFTHEGTLRSYKFFCGKMVDVESFSFTFEDYQKIYSQNQAVSRT